MTKSLTTLCLLLSLTFSSLAQMSAGFTLGCVSYQGDLVYGLLDPREINIGMGVFISKRYANPKFALKGYFQTGTISGNDVNYVNRQKRGFSFTSSVSFVGTTVEYAPLAKKSYDENGEFVSQKNFFMATGIGFTFFNPSVKGLDVKAPDMVAEISKTMATIPLNMGFRFDMNPDWSLALEASLLMPFTDYLDGISIAATPTNSDKYFFYSVSLARKWGDLKSDKLRKK